jgi:hypothetical protein
MRCRLPPLYRNRHLRDRSIAQRHRTARSSKDGKNQGLADAGKDSVHAWNAALACADYRSFLNASSAPSTQGFTQLTPNAPITWDFQLALTITPEMEGKPFRTGGFKTGPHVPASAAFVAEPLGHHLNEGRNVGFAFLLVDDYPTTVDGFTLKNIIFVNSTIIYNGGPVELQGVYFVNCSFRISRQQTGQEFAAAILSNSPATFIHTA